MYLVRFIRIAYHYCTSTVSEITGAACGDMQAHLTFSQCLQQAGRVKPALPYMRFLKTHLKSHREL